MLCLLLATLSLHNSGYGRQVTSVVRKERWAFFVRLRSFFHAVNIYPQRGYEETDVPLSITTSLTYDILRPDRIPGQPLINAHRH